MVCSDGDSAGDVSFLRGWRCRGALPCCRALGNDWGCYWASGGWGDSVGAGVASVSAGLGVGLGVGLSVGLGGAVEESDRSGWRSIGGVLSFQEAVEEPRSVISKNNSYNNQ